MIKALIATIKKRNPSLAMRISLEHPVSIFTKPHFNLIVFCLQRKLKWRQIEPRVSCPSSIRYLPRLILVTHLHRSYLLCTTNQLFSTNKHKCEQRKVKTTYLKVKTPCKSNLNLLNQDLTLLHPASPQVQRVCLVKAGIITYSTQTCTSKQVKGQEKFPKELAVYLKIKTI